MIIVRNTKELEERYNLSQIPDDEQIRVIGGMYNKSKYNSETYERRTTYSGRQIKQIIGQMKEIEETIPNDWNDWQKAKYIYQVLANNIDYNYDSASYGNQQSSNLSILMSKKGVCAGYALTFKEMMDRQGIECDYIRGISNTNRGKTVKHAWNVLTIDGISIPIDLTWDSSRSCSDNRRLKFFGNDTSFFKYHMQEADEKNYRFSLISDEMVESIDVSNQKNKGVLTDEQKFNILSSAIEHTYKKYVNVQGKKIAQNQCKYAVRKYIEEGSANGFTRQGNARDNLVKHLLKEDVLDLLIKQYIKQCESREDIAGDFLGNSLRQNLLKYGSRQAQETLKSYILNGYTRKFYKTKLCKTKHRVIYEF